MKLLLRSLCLLLWLSHSAMAQLSLEGKIKDQATGQVLPFVNVLLYQASDTTKLYVGTITDKVGHYSFEKLTPGAYYIRISSVGYATYQQGLRLMMPSSGFVLSRDFQLSEEHTKLGEVVVTASRTQQYSDHRVLRFTREQIAQATYAKDLLATLPDLRIDPKSGQLATLQGGALLILINGVKATDAQLKMLPPDKVLRVEHYDIPPARYASASMVLNVVTKPLDTGYAWGAETLTAFTTGFNNTQAYYTLSSGKHRFDAEYSLNYRNYNNRQYEVLYEYSLAGLKHRDHTQGRDAFGYTVHNLSLRYAYVDNDKRIFQASLIPNSSKSFSRGNYEGLYQRGATREQLSKDWRKQDKTLHPALDLYYWQRLSERDELSFNVNLNYFDTKGEDRRIEREQANGHKAYEALMELENHKQSLIAELAYSHKLRRLGKLNFGYKVDYSYLSSDLRNVLGAKQYQTHFLEQYSYGELSGGHSKWNYRLSAGLKHIYNRGVEEPYSRFIFTPKLILGYNINRQHSLRLTLDRKPIVPPMVWLSNNVSAITRDIIQRGNPQLKSGSQTELSLRYDYGGRYLNALSGLVYTYSDSPINQYHYTEGNKLIESYRNTVYRQLYGGFVRLLFKPFGTDVLQLTALSIAAWQKEGTPEGIHRYFYWINRFNLTLNYKQFSLNYQYVVPNYNPSGAYHTLTENNNDISLSYKLKQWRFSAGLWFIGQDAHYRTELLEGSPIRYYDDRKIKDNNTMFNLGISYHFQSGKQRSVNRTLNNADHSAPTF